MPRILIINIEHPPVGGGAGYASQTIAYGLSRNYHYQFDIITMGMPNLPKIQTINSKIKIYRLNCWRTHQYSSQPWQQCIFLIKAFFLGLKLMKKKHYAFCHAHFIVPCGFLAYVFHHIKNLKYIISTHGSDVPGYNPKKFKMLHFLLKPWEKRIIKKSQLLLAPSNYLKSLIQTNILNYPVKIIPSGVRDVNQSQVKKEKIILTAGRLVKHKGIDYLIKAFIKLRNPNWRLVIIGDGPEKKALQKIATGQSNISFTGWLDRKSIKYQKYFNQAAIFALPSSSESQGLVYFEAMSTRCAIVALKNGASLEFLNQIGVLVEPENIIQRLTNVLKKLVRKPKIRKKFSNLARQSYEQNFTHSLILEKYAKIYSHIIKP
ncbi:MAG: glycosyltransferase [Candidatus Moranbacteria bacterium]|nr:glycosyltransferase [Candidatus Moranbacteria bacterium]